MSPSSAGRGVRSSSTVACQKLIERGSNVVLRESSGVVAAG